MANNTTEAAAKDIKIYDKHAPALTAGFYKIVVTQKFSVDSNNLVDRKTKKSPNSSLTFEVAAEKFSISPQLVNSVFPPADSLGDFTTVLPNIILNRSTFPWERLANTASSITEDKKKNDEQPWVALLLFSEDEKASLNDFTHSTQNFHKRFTTETVQSSEGNSSPISYVLIGQELMHNILPELEELGYLAHVRGKIGNEQATIVSNRLPYKNKRNFVHLVSVEELFSNGSFVGKAENGADFYRFVSLYNWEFFCSDHFIVTPELIAAFQNDNNISGALLALQNEEYFDSKHFIDAITAKTGTELPEPTQQQLFTTFEVSHLNQILSHLNRTPGTLRLQAGSNNDNLSKMGYLQVPYLLKNGDEIDGAYRGPLVPFRINAGNGLDKPVTQFNGDALFHFMTDVNEVVDISNAAAWELGRLLALSDKKFSSSLFLWKRACYQKRSCYLKHRTNSKEAEYPDMPESVRSWFNNLILLNNIPFNYLVPAEGYLPFESIRFFCIDSTWVRCLVDGAFSIARFSELDAMIDRELYESKQVHLIDVDLYKKQNPEADALNGNLQSGFLLRSRAVSGWPDMVIEGISDTKKAHLVKTNLSPNLSFCRFDVLIDNVSIYQKPDSIHFGLEEDSNGDLFAMSVGEAPVKVPVKVGKNNKIDVNKLIVDMKAGGVSTFAKGLIQKTESVRFTFQS